MKHVDVKVPQRGVVREGVGIVTMNHVGSSIHEDTGRDAQALADRFQVLTIAADRPVSVRRKRLAGELATDAVRATMRVAAAVDRMAEANRLHTLILTGRSAAGLSIMELALTEGVSGAKLLYSAEPVGCYDLDVSAGKKRFADYQAEQAQLLDADDALPQRELVHPNQDAKDLPPLTRMQRLVTMVPLFLRDKALNQRHWNQALVPDYLNRIVASGLRSQIDFAEHSLVLPTDAMQREDLLSNLHAVADNSEGILSVGVADGTTHASFDNRHFYGDRLQAVAAGAGLTLPPPEF